jgi:hypothetical protein
MMYIGNSVLCGVRVDNLGLLFDVHMLLGWHKFCRLWRACNPCSNLHNKGIFSYPIS